MITVRGAGDRGHANNGWLDSHHTFSFADYYDPEHMGFRDLRVINEDRVAAGAGFSSHPHRDMEIISYVIEGAIEHRDSMGNGSVIRPGEVQRMTAGDGVTHSEFNPSKELPVRFLQIWIRPSEVGLRPGYEQKVFPETERSGVLRLVASPEGRHKTVLIHQDVSLYASILEPGEEVVHQIASARHAWVQVIEGSITVNDVHLQAGDGAAVSDEPELRIKSDSSAHFLLFDLR